MGWIKAGIYAIILAFAYLPTLKNLILVDWNRENYIHSYFIPFLVVFIIWKKRQKLSATKTHPSWMGLVPFLTGVALFWLGELGGAHVILYFSLWFVIIGLIWMHLGWQTIKTMWFALVIMTAMFPFPNIFTGYISHQLQLISLKLGVSIVNLFGLSASYEGTYIEFGLTHVMVLEAGTGLRYFVLIIVSSLVLAYFFKALIWKRIVLSLSSIPLAIAVNSLGIVLSGFLYRVLGVQVAEGFFAWFSSWLVFLVALAFLLIEMMVLSRLPPASKDLGVRRMEEIDGQGEVQDGQDLALAVDKSGQGWAKGKPVSAAADGHLEASSSVPKVLQPQFVAAIILLAATLVLSKTVEFREKAPMSMPFDQFPMEIGEWTGTRQTMEQILLNVLYFNDYIIIDYRNKQGEEVNFYVAYYKSQTKRESIQSPEMGLPIGWSFKKSKNTSIVLTAQGLPPSIEVKSAFLQKQGAKRIVYFWFPMRGRVLTEPYQVKLANFWDAIVRQRTDGALVRVITPVYRRERMVDAQVRLMEFVREVMPVLVGFIPE